MLESASTSGAGVLSHRHLYNRLGDFIGRRRLSVAERPHTRLAAGTLGSAASPTLGERSRLALSCSLELGELLVQLFVGRRQLRNLPLQLRDQPHQFVALRGREVFGLTHSQSIKTCSVPHNPPTDADPANQLRFPKGLSGADLARRATAQAIRFGTEVITAQEVTRVRVEDPYRIVTLSDGTELSCHALLISTGVSVTTLNVPGIDAVAGAGVYYGAAVTEAAFYRGQHLFVVGGSNSAGMGVTFLSQHASKVTMLVRAAALEIEMSQYLVDQINATENIEVKVRTEVVEVKGEQRLEAITTRNNETGEEVTEPATAMFIFVGARPHTEMVEGVVERDADGFIFGGDDLVRNGKRPRGWRLKRDPFLLETSVPGIFVAGDVRSGAPRRVASAVGQGAVAISFVHQYLKTV